MTICHINATYGTGSTGTIVREISELSRLNDIRSVVGCKESSFGDSIIIGNSFTWFWHKVITRLIGREGYHSKRETIRFLKKLNLLKPDIIHLHNLHANYVHLGLILNYAELNKIPVVLTLHDCWFFTGKCCHFVDCYCYKWKTICEHCPKKYSNFFNLFGDSARSSFLSKLKDFGKLNSLYVVGCSKWITKLADSSPIFRNGYFLTIHNGIDLNVFSPQQHDFFSVEFRKNNPFVALIFADKLFHPMNRLFLKKIKSIKDITFCVAACTKRQMKILNKIDNILAIGRVDKKEDMATLFSSCNVFLNISYADTLPTVNMESICCGTPVISYDCCGGPELIIEGKTGFIVKEGDVDALIGQLLKLKDLSFNKSECSKIGKENFDYRDNLIEYIYLYKKIARAKSQ